MASRHRRLDGVPQCGDHGAGERFGVWISEENAVKAQLNELMKGYFANVRKVYSGIEGKVTKYEWGKEVAPGITAIDTHGHTPGHTSFVVPPARRRF